MMVSNIAKRYARAFFDVEGSHDRCYDELKRLVSVLEANRGLKDFLSNPVFGNEDRKAVIGKILVMLDISPSTANFLNLLVDKRRISILREIEDAYRKLMDSAMGVVKVQVKTAFPLVPKLSDSLKRALESFTGKRVDMQVEEDASLLGGIVVRVGDKLYDGSVKTQLNNMIKLLGEEI